MRKNEFPFAKTVSDLIIGIGIAFFLCLILFVVGNFPAKVSAGIAFFIIAGYMIYSFMQEKKADHNALDRRKQMASGEYFESADWHNKYVTYIHEHPFEIIKNTSMKRDLLRRFRHWDYLLWMVFTLFLIFVFASGMKDGVEVNSILGVCLFGALFFLELLVYMGLPVRKWLRGVSDYDALERSYLNGRGVSFKKSGLIFGTTHIHAYTDRDIYAIDLALVEGISRKIVRLKKYQDGLFASEEYPHFAVIHVKQPKSGRSYDVEIELNEYQVQMVIDRLSSYKAENTPREEIELSEERKDEVVY